MCFVWLSFFFFLPSQLIFTPATTVAAVQSDIPVVSSSSSFPCQSAATQVRLHGLWACVCLPVTQNYCEQLGCNFTLCVYMHFFLSKCYCISAFVCAIPHKKSEVLGTTDSYKHTYNIFRLFLDARSFFIYKQNFMV